MKYNDKFDAEQQVTLEERIAAIIYDEAEVLAIDDVVSEDSANDLSKKILQMVVAELRPDLVDVEDLLNNLMEREPDVVVDWMKSMTIDYICPDCPGRQG